MQHHARGCLHLQVAVEHVFTATLADLLAILEKATSGETGIHASGGNRGLAGCAVLCAAWRRWQRRRLTQGPAARCTRGWA